MKVVTMRGKTLDMARLIAQNSDKIAVGNASMNARGDIVGPGGTIVKLREDIAREYHRNRPKVTKQMSLRDIPKEQFISPEEAIIVSTEPTAAQSKPRKRISDD